MNKCMHVHTIVIRITGPKESIYKIRVYDVVN